MTRCMEDTDKRKGRKTAQVHPSTLPLAHSSLRRHRSLNEKKSPFTNRVGDAKVTFTDSVDRASPSSPVYCLVCDLNFTKIVNQLINNPSARKSAFLLQALRQQITITNSKAYVERTIGILSEKDVLSLKHRKHSAVATILMGTENGYEVKDQLCRLLNALSSFKSGRQYLLTVGGGKELWVQLLAALRARRVYGHAHDNALATVQKCSIRPSVCRELLSLGYFEWLLSTIEAGRMSHYGSEFSAALMLNLLLNINSPALLARHSDQILSCLTTLLRLKNPGVCMYINGAMYAALSFGRIRARARETKFESQLQWKLSNADCAFDHLHIPFLLKQMKGETEMVRVPVASDEFEDTTTDNCEGEIESTDVLQPIGAELAGAKLLLAKVLSESSSALNASSISCESLTAKEEEEERNAPPGTASRSRQRRQNGRHKSGRVPATSRAEPKRIHSAASQATFTVEAEGRRPLTQPLSLSQLSISLRSTMEKEKARESKENLREPSTSSMSEPKSGRSPLRKAASKATAADVNGNHVWREKEKRSLSPSKELTSTSISSPTKPTASTVKSRTTQKGPSPTTEREKSEMETQKSGRVKSARRPVKVPTKDTEESKSKQTESLPSEPPPYFPSVTPSELLSQSAAPVTGKVPERIPDDAVAHDYISVFGSRPKVPRTPDMDKPKPSTVLLY